MKKRNLTMILILILSLFIIVGALYFLNQKFHFLADVDTQNYYVAINGDDSWSGTLKQPNVAGTDGPFKTIEKAKDRVRVLKKTSGLASPVAIKIENGTYNLANTLEFTEEDSGTSDFPITYEGYGGKTTISGGEHLEGVWTKCSTADPKCAGLPAESINNVYYSNVGTKTFNSLFVNDSRATRARTPNDGQDTGNRGSSGNIIGAGFYNIAECQIGATGDFTKKFLFREGDIDQNWKNINDIETVLMVDWRTARYKIHSIDGNSVNILGEAKYSLDTDECQHSSVPGTRYYLDNVFEGLDTAGEWYLDKNAHDLFYYPGSGENVASSSFTAPDLQQLINISGTQNDQVANIKFKNLIFQNTDWSLPNDQSDLRLQGLWDIQSLAPVSPIDQDIYRLNYPSSPTIFLNRTNGIDFSNNIFNNLGGHALQAYHSSNLVVKNNEFKNLGMNGVVFGDTAIDQLKKAETLPISSGGFSISNNIIHNYGQVNPSGVGILGLLAKDSTVSNNHIYNGGYNGIQVGWDWHDKDNGANRIKVEKNHVHDVCRVFNDGAGIYMVGTHLESSMSSNLVHNVERTSAQLYNYNPIGLYLDNHSSGVTQENNVVFNNNLNLNYNGNSRDIVVRNNIAVSFKEEPNAHISKPQGTFNFSNNIIYTGSDKTYMRVWAPSAKVNDQEIWDYSKISMNNNLYYSLAGAFKFGLLDRHNLIGLADFKKDTGLDASTVEADPQFSDPSAFDPNNTSDYLQRDYSLMPTSPALTLGFKQINTSDIGPQGTVGPVYTSPFEAPDCLSVVGVPDSIDSTGATDVSAALLSFFGTVADGSKVVFKKNGIYRIDSSLRLTGRHHLVFDGNGATIMYGGSSTGLSTGNSIFVLASTPAPNSNITFKNFKLFGNSTSPGQYVKGQEYQMAFLISGSTNIDIHDNEITGTWGDAFYLANWADSVDIYNNHVFSNGRDAVSIIAARNVSIWNNKFDLGGSVFDLEPNVETEGANNIRLQNNTIGSYGIGGKFFAANGVLGSSISNVIVSGNTITNDTLDSNVTLATRRQNITFANNTSLVSTAADFNTYVLRFYNIDGISVYGNNQPLSSGSYLVTFRDCTNTITDPPANVTLPVPTPTANPEIVDCSTPKSSFVSSVNLFDNQVITTNPYIISLRLKDPSDTLKVSKIEFYVDDILISTATLPDVSGTYQAVWDTSKYHSVVKVIVYIIDGTTQEIIRNTTVNLSETQENNDIVVVLPKTGETSLKNRMIHLVEKIKEILQ